MTAAAFVLLPAGDRWIEIAGRQLQGGTGTLRLISAMADRPRPWGGRTRRLGAAIGRGGGGKLTVVLLTGAGGRAGEEAGRAEIGWPAYGRGRVGVAAAMHGEANFQQE